MKFQPDYRHMLNVLSNKRPDRLPLYEHIISPVIMEKILNVQFAALALGDFAANLEFFKHYCRFFREMTYDTVSFEVCITDILPDNGAIMGGKPGPIQNREDFDRFPWDELSDRYWEKAKPLFNALAQSLPPGMKAVGGVGNGVFEISEDLVGFEYLAYMQVNDPELYTSLYLRIGDLMYEIWEKFLHRYSSTFSVCRFGDDLGFKTSTLINPMQIRQHIIPQYTRIVDLIHNAGKPFLWHSCGNIFSVMEDMIKIGINAKHSNEDAIAPFEKWISLYGDRIALLGGIDVDILCLQPVDEIFENVRELGQRYRQIAQGYALGSGNSIPDYVPVEGYLAMIEAGQKIRELENGGNND
jgi:uroporphyrinogen decarboxylase